MGKILYIAATECDGSLAKTSLEGLQAATKLAGDLGTDLCIGLIGKDAPAAAKAIGGCAAAAYYAVEGADFEQSRYASDVAAIEAIQSKAGAEYVLLPGTSRLCRVAAGAAQRLGGRADTSITELAVDGGKVIATRWYYRQRMSGTFTREQRPWVLQLSPGSWPAWEGAATDVAVETIAVDLADTAKRTQFVEVQSQAGDQQTIRPEAELLFVAGAGWTKKQSDGQVQAKRAETVILQFLDTAKASLGSSKSLVDQGSEGEEVLSFMSHLHQVGQTGATPRHPKGLATCCHGEEPHVVGWRFINERRAVNTDASCGWAQGKADVLYVADAFEVMEAVNKLLSE